MEEDDAAMEEEEEEPEPAEEDAFEEEPEEEATIDPTPAGFDMANAMVEFEAAQAEELAEQQALIESFKSEHVVEANRRILRRRKAEINELFAELEEEDEDEDEPDVCLAANDHEAGGSGTNFVDISDDEDE